MVHLKVQRVGKSLGVRLPAKAAEALGVKEGDTLYLTPAPGGYQLTPFDPDFDDAMKAAEGFLARYRNALRELAK